MRAPRRLVVEVQAVSHRAVCESCRDCRQLAAETEYRALFAPTALLQQLDQSSHCRFHATGGQCHAQRVENRLFCALDSIFGQILVACVGHKRRKVMAEVQVVVHKKLLRKIRSAKCIESVCCRQSRYRYSWKRLAVGLKASAARRPAAWSCLSLRLYRVINFARGAGLSTVR